MNTFYNLAIEDFSEPIRTVLREKRKNGFATFLFRIGKLRLCGRKSRFQIQCISQRKSKSTAYIKTTQPVLKEG